VAPSGLETIPEWGTASTTAIQIVTLQEFWSRILQAVHGIGGHWRPGSLTSAGPGLPDSAKSPAVGHTVCQASQVPVKPGQGRKPIASPVKIPGTKVGDCQSTMIRHPPSTNALLSPAILCPNTILEAGLQHASTYAAKLFGTNLRRKSYLSSPPLTS
jgi:hypothetical protein